MNRRFYQDELNYLLEAGKEFSQAHPEHARYLNLESVADRDPYVERLFEGFAFLAARIRERLNDELPELTESLFNLLWPNFLRPVPALAILEFQPKRGLVQKTTRIAAGTEVHSVPVGDDNTVCRFRTAHDVQLQPLMLQDATLVWAPDATTNVTLSFELEKGIEYQNLNLNPLRLFFHAEDQIASTMYLFFTRHVHKVVFRSADQTGGGNELAGQQWIRPGGLGGHEALMPSSPYSFAGQRYLQEYFAFRRRFWFVDLYGFDRFVVPPKVTGFKVQICFDRAYPEERRFKTENLRLFCVPIANLFRTDAEPVRVDHTRFEYRVIPDVRHPRTVEPYSVDSVVGTEEATGERHDYHPFYSFGQAGRSDGRYFTTSTRIGPSERPEMFISPGGFHVQEKTIPVEVLSLEVTCTNGTLPREKLQTHMITEPSADFPNIASFENLTQPTLCLYPPVLQSGTETQPAEYYLWKVLSHLSLNMMSLATREALRAVLELYDWSGTDANRMRIAGIRAVQWKPKEILRRGAVVRGAQVVLEIQDGQFADEGDLCLFGLLLAEFLDQYATINSFVHLQIITKPSEHVYQWEPQRGMLPVV
jgi:type VI secretion system protein ImpG